jgi:hypothetical protein
MDVAFRIVRIGSTSYSLPLFIDQNQSDALSEIIDNFENSLGLKEDEFDSNFIFEIFSDSKIAKGVYFVLTKHFYDLKGLESIDLSSFEYRIKLFSLMEIMNINWASYRQQKQILQLLSENESMDLLKIEQQLFGDYSDNFKIIRKTEQRPKVELVIITYNSELLKFLFSKTYTVTFTLSDYSKKGFFIKNFIRNTKFFGLPIEFEIDEDNNKNMKVNLPGPNELAGRNVKYSSYLTNFFIKYREEFMKAGITKIFLFIQYFENKKDVILPFEEFPLIISESLEDNLYDSAIEKYFSEQWLINFPHWALDREPLIIEGNLVMIPDFLLSYNEQSFYFEIIGFWTEKYLTKKLKKISLLKSKYPNMILLVDKHLDWPNNTGVKTFYYNKLPPILEIGFYLKSFEEVELKKKIETLDFDKIKSKLDNLVQNIIIVEELDLLNICSLTYSFELRIFFELFYLKYQKSGVDFIYFSTFSTIILVKFIINFKNTCFSLFEEKKMNLNELKQFFPNLNDKLLRYLVLYIGFDFRYKSLIEEEVFFKKEKVIIPEII